jgi:hypothetical protein
MNDRGELMVFKSVRDKIIADLNSNKQFINQKRRAVLRRFY